MFYKFTQSNTQGNTNSGDMHRLWIDDITTIKATNSMAINVSKDLNLTGAAILSDNLALAVSGNINKQDLQDSYYSENYNLGLSINSAINGNQSTITGTGGKPNQTPGGSTGISASYAQNESSRTVYATIGSLSATKLDDSDPNKLKLTSATNDVIGGDFEASITLDHRLFSQSGRGDIAKNFKELGVNLKTMRETANQSPLKIGAILNAPNTLLEGAIYTFDEPDSKLYLTNILTGEVREVTKADLAKNYAVNGVATDLNALVKNYLNNNPELIVRHNPTHGILGDLVESSLSKVANWTGQEDLIAMNNYVKGDIYDRRDLRATINPLTGNIEPPINLFHSQGTIIGEAAMKLYAHDYIKPILTYAPADEGVTKWNEVGGSLNLSYTNQINPTQRFVAVGPAVLESDWGSAVKSLGLSFDGDNDYRHDPLDPVRYTTAPSNIVNQITNFLGSKNQNSSIYIPNLYDPLYGAGLGLSDGLNAVTNGYLYKAIGKDLPNIEHHDVKNPYYQQPLQLKTQ